MNGEEVGSVTQEAWKKTKEEVRFVAVATTEGNNWKEKEEASSLYQLFGLI